MGKPFGALSLGSLTLEQAYYGQALWRSGPQFAPLGRGSEENTHLREPGNSPSCWSSACCLHTGACAVTLAAAVNVHLPSGSPGGSQRRRAGRPALCLPPAAHSPL